MAFEQTFAIIFKELLSIISCSKIPNNFIATINDKSIVECTDKCIFECYCMHHIRI